MEEAGPMHSHPMTTPSCGTDEEDLTSHFTVHDPQVTLGQT